MPAVKKQVKITISGKVTNGGESEEREVSHRKAGFGAVSGYMGDFTNDFRPPEAGYFTP